MSYRIISTPGPWRTVASTLRFVEKYPSCVPWLSRRTEERGPDGSSTGRLLVPKPAQGARLSAFHRGRGGGHREGRCVSVSQRFGQK